ncbi:hypothetical protein [Vreelandella aquamarina]|uniref:hypothetical protein n=1 Tax=Vreelandella aquamarina TaxID=77097 RepID=UPI00078335CF|nr:hypothetical protein [Halomonas axialensis]
MRLHRLFIPVVLSLLLSSANAVAQHGFPTTRQASIDASQAFGFLYGQKLTLEYIRSHYPDLAAQVKIAEAATNLAYAEADTYLESVLVDVIGQDGIAKLIAHFDAEMVGIPATQAQSRSDALAFLEEVRARANNPRNIPSPIRELLLTAAYAERPVEEMLDGHRTLFSTSGHDKAAGLDLTLTLPLSWLASEGRRPHIVQKWRSQAGHGRVEIMLLIMGLGMPTTPQEVDDLIANTDFSSWVPEGGRHLGTARRRIDNQPAVAIDYEITQDMGIATVLIRGRQYVLFVGDMGISLQCQSGATVGDSPTSFDTLPKARDSATQIFTHNEKVCELVANSIVIDQLWK